MVETKEDDFLIENQDLIGAISSSLARGETLKGAMLSLYNSGYEKTKIEEAARAYIELSRNQDRTYPSRNQISTTPMQEEQVKDKEKEKDKDKEKVKKANVLDQALAAKAMQQPVVVTGGTSTSTVQHVSKYEAKSRPKNKVHNTSNLVTFLLVFILIFLLLILGAVFLFKEELVDFFNRLFS